MGTQTHFSASAKAPASRHAANFGRPLFAAFFIIKGEVGMRWGGGYVLKTSQFARQCGEVLTLLSRASFPAIGDMLDLIGVK
jgi:hypothetical protein